MPLLWVLEQVITSMFTLHLRTSYTKWHRCNSRLWRAYTHGGNLLNNQSLRHVNLLFFPAHLDHHLTSPLCLLCELAVNLRSCLHVVVAIWCVLTCVHIDVILTACKYDKHFRYYLCLDTHLELRSFFMLGTHSPRDIFKTFDKYYLDLCNYWYFIVISLFLVISQHCL